MMSNEMATATGVLTSTQPIQQPRIIKVVRVTNSDVISTQAARKRILAMKSSQLVHLPVKPPTRPSNIGGRPLIGRRRLIRMSDSSCGGSGRRIIRGSDASMVVETAAKPAAVKVEPPAERTKIIFVSNSKTARATSTGVRARRRSKKQQQLKQEEQNNDNQQQADAMTTMTSPRREFDIENDKLTAAWHSLVNSVTKSSSSSQQQQQDNHVTNNQLFEFSVQNRGDDVSVCNDDDVIMHPPPTPSSTQRPASGEKRSAVCSLTSSTSSSPNVSDVDDDVIVADDVVDAASEERRRKSSEKSSSTASGFFKFRGRKILRKDDHHVTTVGNKLVTMATNLIPHKPITAKGEILPMKLRAFPSSFWEQPNDVTTYDVLPPVQPLFKNHTGDDVTNIRPVTPPNGRIINRRKKEIVKVTDDSTNLLMRLFDSVEPNQRQTGIRPRRGRPRKTPTISASTSTKQQQQQHDDNPCIIESITEKLLYKLTLDHPHTLLSPLCDDVTNDDVYNNAITPSLRHNMMMSLPQLSNVSNEGFSLLLSEVAAVL